MFTPSYYAIWTSLKTKNLCAIINVPHPLREKSISYCTAEYFTALPVIFCRPTPSAHNAAPRYQYIFFINQRIKRLKKLGPLFAYKFMSFCDQ